MDNFEIKRKLETHKCSVHHQSPTVTVTGEGLSLSCCCEKFRDELTSLTEEYAGQEVLKDIDDMLRKAFR